MKKAINILNYKRIILFFLFLFIFSLIVTIICFKTFKYRHISKYITDDNKIIYTIGTIHSSHYENKLYNYTYEQLINLIRNTKATHVFIESRKETFENYNAIDGPSEMEIIYAYCLDNDIDVHFIDSWSFSDNMMVNTFDNSRDNKIFNNILNELLNIPKNETIAIFYGATHYETQKSKNFKAGWEELKIKNKSLLFDSTTKFSYSKSTIEVLENTKEYYKSGAIDEINKNITNNDLRAEMIYKYKNEVPKYIDDVISIVKKNKNYK